MKTKLEKHTAVHRDMRKAGYVAFNDGGDTAYVWTHTAWSPSMTIERGDMTAISFTQMIWKIAAIAKAAK